MLHQFCAQSQLLLLFSWFQASKPEDNIVNEAQADQDARVFYISLILSKFWHNKTTFEMALRAGFPWHTF